MPIVCSHSAQLLFSYADSYPRLCISYPFNYQRSAVLKHHIITVESRQLQPPIITRDSLVYHFRYPCSPFSIRVHRIGQKLWVSIQRTVEVYQLYLRLFGNALYSPLYFFVPITSPRLKARMRMPYRSHQGNKNAHLRVYLLKTIDKSEIISNKIIAIIRPVARVSIVDTQVNHHYISPKSKRLLVFLLFYIRAMTFA